MQAGKQDLASGFLTALHILELKLIGYLIVKCTCNLLPAPAVYRGTMFLKRWRKADQELGCCPTASQSILEWED